MAIVFELYVECLEKSDADNIASHFSNFKFELLNGTAVSVHVTQQFGSNGAFGVAVFPKLGLSLGIRSLQNALDCTEAGLRLYKYLQEAPKFDFAHVGIEAEQTSMADLSNFIHPIGTLGSETWMNLQCVVSDNLYEKLGRPKYFREFRPGYMWNRYCGENYSPLFSKDQEGLNSVCKQLFPESFDSRLWL